MTYNYKIVRQFSIMTVIWGVIGMLVGVIIAAQLMFPDMAYGVSWLAYGRLRPLHTNAVIFAFGGSALFATSGMAGSHRTGGDHAPSGYYQQQGVCRTRVAD
jgi:cbb3-type cytochrome oxidase subunit 1